MNVLFCQRYIITASFLSGISNAGDVYKFRCPEQSEKKLLSKRCPNPIQFHCLLNAGDELYTWECRNREWVIKGNYAVRRGLRHYIDYEYCPLSRYQPFIYWSNEDHQCQIVKSLCSEEGQVQYDNGTTTSNKGCRCDYIRGYDFLVPPKNKCFCVPSEEDCSCLQNSYIDIHRQNADGRLFFVMTVVVIIVTIAFGLMVIGRVSFCRLEIKGEESASFIPKERISNK